VSSELVYILAIVFSEAGLQSKASDMGSRNVPADKVMHTRVL